SGSCAYSRNSKIPCLPEFFPVMTPVQATGLKGGKTECKVPDAPRARIRARLGRSPAAASGSRISHVAPSRPSTKTFMAPILVPRAPPHPNRPGKFAQGLRILPESRSEKRRQVFRGGPPPRLLNIAAAMSKTKAAPLWESRHPEPAPEKG